MAVRYTRVFSTDTVRTYNGKKLCRLGQQIATPNISYGNWENPDEMSCYGVASGVLLPTTDVIIAHVYNGKLVTRIYPEAFNGYSGITSFTIPDTITLIGARAFYNCTALESITFLGTIAQWEAITKQSQWCTGCRLLTVIHCSDGDVPMTSTVAASIPEEELEGEIPAYDPNAES